MILPAVFIYKRVTSFDLMANHHLKPFFFTLGVGQTVKVLPQRESARPIKKCAEVQYSNNARPVCMQLSTLF